MDNTIPIIDLAPLLSGEAEGLRQLGSDLYQVYSTLGFGLIINHGISSRIIADVFSASKAFHALSMKEKMQLKYKQHLRGYLPMDTAALKTFGADPCAQPNQSESYIFLNELASYQTAQWQNSVFAGKNVWPSQLPEFQMHVMNYYHAARNLGKTLMEAFAAALSFPQNYFHHYFAVPHIFLRLLYYPPVSKPRTKDLYGSAPHIDYSCLTIVAQDELGGLQVKTRDGEWLDVPCIPGSLVLNTGQIMSTWTNGRLKATYHRVINNCRKPRYSVPFFYNCNIDTYIKPLPGMVSGHYPLAVRNASYGEDLDKMLRANYDF